MPADPRLARRDGSFALHAIAVTGNLSRQRLNEGGCRPVDRKHRKRASAPSARRAGAATSSEVKPDRQWAIPQSRTGSLGRPPGITRARSGCGLFAITRVPGTRLDRLIAAPSPRWNALRTRHRLTQDRSPPTVYAHDTQPSDGALSRPSARDTRTGELGVVAVAAPTLPAAAVERPPRDIAEDPKRCGALRLRTPRGRADVRGDRCAPGPLRRGPSGSGERVRSCAGCTQRRWLGAAGRGYA
jgi:hypothetical protein